MAESEHYPEIIDKLKNGMQFGLFEDGAKCYFRDGSKVSYTDLWKALRKMHGLESGHNKTIAELCPSTFAGTFPYKHSQHRWKRK
jgi:hypothetical protein